MSYNLYDKPRNNLNEQSPSAVSQSQGVVNHPLEGAAERFIKARSRSVLHVEDNAAHAALVRRSLEQDGWTIEHVTRASVALQSFSTDPDKIVLLDLTLPDSDGLDILKRMLKINPRSPVIIVTSLEQVSTSVEAMKQGAIDYVVKSEPQETAAKLREAVARAYHKRLQQAQEDLIAEAKVFELVRAERLEAIELVVRTVCHEVNNPLTGVVALSQLLGEKTAADSDIKRLADGILKSAQEVARVVQKLHSTQDSPGDFTKKEFGGQEILDLPVTVISES
jgi:DNA-binding response OmpR family regulator